MLLAPRQFALLILLVLPHVLSAAQLQPVAQADSNLTFTLPDYRDDLHSLSDYQGKVVLVNFWASWCPPCIKEMPALARLRQKLDDHPFEVIALNVGEKKHKVWKFTRLIKYHLTVLLDPSQEVFDTWQVQSLPTSYLVDATGKLRYKVRGDPDWDDESTIQIIKQLIDETK